MVSRLLISLFRTFTACVKPSRSSAPSPPPIISRYSEPVKEIEFEVEDEDNGCDYKHWLILVKEPVGSRDEIITFYVDLVAHVLGSEDEARKNIYSVSTRYYFAVGVLLEEDVAYKFKQLPGVLDVIPDCYDRVNKDYGGEPFVHGKAVPYDPKHHDFYMRVQVRIRTGNGKIDMTDDGWLAYEDR